MKKYFFAGCLLILLVNNYCFAQVTPPGLGKTNAVVWAAIGLRHDMDTVKKWQSMSYFGVGRKSNPDNYNPLYKPAIVIFNQEFYRQLSTRWQYSLAVSYRRQDEYDDNYPYEYEDPKIKQEFRVYGRFSHIFKTGRLKLVPTFRQEFRKFYAPDFTDVSENLQLRSRFRLQLTVNLDASKIHRLIAASEQLFAVSKNNAPDAWTDFKYKESRFALYYSLSLPARPFVFNLGYMNNVLPGKSTHYGHYIGVDITFVNPFKIKRKKKEGADENLE